MRTATIALCLMLAAPALGADNETFRIEPDEQRTHGCSLRRTFVNIEAATLTKVAGMGSKTDATPGSCSTDGGCVAGGALISVDIVDDDDPAGGTCTACVIEFEIDPDAGGTDRDGNGYKFHGRGRDANGHKWTCNGPVLIKSRTVDF